MDRLLKDFASGTLTHQEIFADHGHGSLIYAQEPFGLGEGAFDVVITGPRRNLMRESDIADLFCSALWRHDVNGMFWLAGCCCR